MVDRKQGDVMNVRIGPGVAEGDRERPDDHAAHERRRVQPQQERPGDKRGSGHHEEAGAE